MKRITLIITVFFCCFAARASVVSPEKAYRTASAFFGGAALSQIEESTVTKASSSPEIYIFNNPAGGWAIIAGEDSVSPVLAYSNSGSFRPDELGDNLSWWLDNIKSGINEARKEGRTASASVRSAWADGGQVTKSAGKSVYLETATWSQNSPYNFYCPEVTESEGESGEKIYTSVTGCAATAAAIILRYHKYPANGIGTLPDYSYISDFNVRMNIEGYDISSHKYNYESMPLTNTEVQAAGSSSQQQIAQLIHDVGVAFKSEYNYKNGTAVSEYDISGPLVSNFGYSADVRSVDRLNYDLGDWIATLKDELDNNRPVLYGGYSNSGGHMFVLAGYDESDLFYVNWGWAGLNNGYFTIKNLVVDEDKKFSQNQLAYLWLQPEQGGESKPEILFRGSGITITSGSPVQGQDFKLEAADLYNFTYQDYDGSVKMALVNYKDSLKSYVGSEYAITIPKMESEYIIHHKTLEDYTCNIASEMVFGDGLALFYKIGTDSWKIVPYDHESGKVFRYAAFDDCAINIPDDIKAGDVIAPSILKGQREISSLVWFLNGIQITSGQTEALIAGAHTLKAVITFADGNTETITQEIKVN